MRPCGCIKTQRGTFSLLNFIIIPYSCLYQESQRFRGQTGLRQNKSTGIVMLYPQVCALLNKLPQIPSPPPPLISLGQVFCLYRHYYPIKTKWLLAPASSGFPRSLFFHFRHCSFIPDPMCDVDSALFMSITPIDFLIK